MPVPNLYKEHNIKKIDIKNGYKYLLKNNDKRNLVISQGYQTNRLFEKIKLRKFKNKFNLIDIIRSKPFPIKVISELKKYKNIIIIDEQILSSSLTSIIAEILIHHRTNINVKSFHLNEKHVFENGGREKLLNNNGLNINKILDYLKKL